MTSGYRFDDLSGCCGLPELSKAISSVALGSRVIGENPRPWEVDQDFPEPETDTWVRISSTLRRTDTALIEMELLRPRAWVEENEIVPEPG